MNEDSKKYWEYLEMIQEVKLDNTNNTNILLVLDDDLIEMTGNQDYIAESAIIIRDKIQGELNNVNRILKNRKYFEYWTFMNVKIQSGIEGVNEYIDKKEKSKPMEDANDSENFIKKPINE